MAKSSLVIKQLAKDSAIQCAIQIASIQAASKIDKTKSESLTVLVNRILQNPDDTNWWQIITYYVIINNQDKVEWEKFQEKQEEIEQLLVDMCSDAISQIGS